MAALLSTSIPLNKTVTVVMIAVSSTSSIVAHPSARDLEKAASSHVLVYSSYGEVLIVESEGHFDIDIWESVAKVAKRACCGEPPIKDDVSSEKSQEAETGLQGDLRRLVSAAILSR